MDRSRHTGKTQTYGPHGWAFEAESIERLPEGVQSLGIGEHLIRQSGSSRESLLAGLLQMRDKLIDNGVNVVEINGVRCYIHPRGKAIDMGTREDFEELGWTDICDFCDEQIAEQDE